MYERKVLNLAVIVSALGYFVDIFDLLLFSIVRVQSLKDIGVSDSELLSTGLSLLNDQMIGVLIGGIFWGILGDKRGRVSVLFGSIFLYSIANLGNAFVHSVEAYSWMRLIAGIGLSGELGLAITLVSEILPKEKRGYATTIIASFGVLGSVAAAGAASIFHWRSCYILGGVLGLVLLILRIKIQEPQLFKEAKAEGVRRGNFLMLFSERERFLKFINIVLVGAPVWFAIGIIVSFSPEIAKALGVIEPVTSMSGVMFAYVGLSLGDLTSGLWSQIAQSRRKVLRIYLSFLFLSIATVLLGLGQSSLYWYSMCFLIGFSTGYWTVINTVAAESFGTNIRSTVATSAPNFIRASLVPMAFAFDRLKPSLGIVGSLWVLLIVVLAIAFLSLRKLPETYGRDLRYTE